MYGKFSSQEDEELYALSLDGGSDEECGDVSEYGVWFGLMREERAILSENSDGFVSVQWFDSEAETISAWAEIEAEVNDWYEQTEEE